MKILVQLCGGLGDELCLTPTYRALKTKYPGCEITAHVIYREMLLHNESVDHLLKYGRHNPDKTKYQKLIIMQWQTGKYLSRSNMHLVDFFAMQAQVKPIDKTLVFNVVEDDRKTLKKLNLPKNRPIVTFDAYANKPANRWGSKYFRETISYLKEKHNAIIIQIGVNSYNITGVDINLTKEKLVSLKKQDIGIRETAAIIQASDLYIGNNSGAAHIASAVKTPSVKIFGCTNPKYYLHNENLERAVFLDIPCQGCQNDLPGENPIQSKHMHCCDEHFKQTKEWACLIDLLPWKVNQACDEVLEQFYYSGKRNII